MEIKCDNCGNHYAKTFQVIKSNTTFYFDSFECAIQRLAPQCEACGTRIIGHGLEADSKMYCCAHCARRLHVEDFIDNIN